MYLNHVGLGAVRACGLLQLGALREELEAGAWRVRLGHCHWRLLLGVVEG